MLTTLTIAAAISALLAIAAESAGAQRHQAFYVLKPLTTLLILGIALCGPEGDYRTAVAIGLVLSMLGDICLMFAGNAWFLGGLGSFLIAHFLFVYAYAEGLSSYGVPVWCWAGVVYGLGFFAWLLPKTGSLKGPVLIYGLALMGMVLAASARWQANPGLGTTLAMLGAFIFMVSDSALAVRQFNGAYRGAQPLILSTYWLAIGLIAWSVGLGA
jgi:alkenylglycerophosphocholine/alkenylglycerophosphoethanolamine hydrolase